MGRPKGSTNAKSVPKKAPKAADSSAYQASVKVFGKLFTAEGATCIEAITNLKPGVARGMSIVTVIHNGRTQEKVLPMHLTARLFSPSATMREFALKTLSMRFDL